VILLLWLLWGQSRASDLVSAMQNPANVLFYSGVVDGTTAAIVLVLVFSAALSLAGLMRLFWRIAEDRYFFSAVFSVSVAVQALIIFWLRTPPFSDAAIYVDHAQRLLETASYLRTDGVMTAFWPVGYPALLATLQWLTGDMLTMARLLNVVANASLLLIYRALFSRMFSVRESAVFTLFIALHPVLLFSSVILMTEQVFMVLLWGAILLLHRSASSPGVMALAGLLLGFAAYVKPVGLIFAVGFAVHIVVLKRRPLPAMVMLLVMLVVLSPWVMRNWQVFDGLVPVSTNGGYNFLMGNHSGANGGINFDFHYEYGEINELQASGAAYSQALSDIVTHPIQSSARLPMKLIHAYWRFDAPLIWALKPLTPSPPAMFTASALYLSNMLHYIVLFAAVFAMRLRGLRTMLSVLPPLSITLYILAVLIILLHFGSDRFLLPLLPIHAAVFVRSLRWI
jgi:hypothetical protein